MVTIYIVNCNYLFMNMLMRPTTTTYQSQHKVSALRCRAKILLKIHVNNYWICMCTKFGGLGLFAFRDFALFLLFFKFPFRTMDSCLWAKKSFKQCLTRCTCALNFLVFLPLKADSHCTRLWPEVPINQWCRLRNVKSWNHFNFYVGLGNIGQ